MVLVEFERTISDKPSSMADLVVFERSAKYPSTIISNYSVYNFSPTSNSSPPLHDRLQHQLSWVVLGLFLKPKNKSQFFSNTVLLPPTGKGNRGGGSLSQVISELSAVVMG